MVRPSVEIPLLKVQHQDMNGRMLELERTVEIMGDMIEDLRESVAQFQTIMECGNVPAPVFLRWAFTTEEGCRVARATFGKYLLEVVNGKSAVSWSITQGDRWLDAGGGMVHFEMGMDEAERALTRVVQASKAGG
jgi:hypothetical protein